MDDDRPSPYLLKSIIERVCADQAFDDLLAVDGFSRDDVAVWVAMGAREADSPFRDFSHRFITAALERNAAAMGRG